MNGARAEEYRAVASDAGAALAAPEAERTRVLRRLRAENRRIRRRDFFHPPEREHARQAINDLATSLDRAPTIDEGAIG